MRKRTIPLTLAAGAAAMMMLAGCAGGAGGAGGSQSVAQACEIANTEVESAMSDLTAAMGGDTSGLGTLADTLDSTVEKVTNAEVKEPLKVVAEGMHAMAEAFDGVDFTDPAAAAEATTKLDAVAGDLESAGAKLQELCG